MTPARNAIAQSIAATVEVLRGNPSLGLSVDSTAVAVIVEGLRCKVTGPSGAVLNSDMPTHVGGNGTSPTPGWLLRAALASCDATLIAMRAAQLGIVLHTLKVQVDSVSDTRGLLGIDDSVPAGTLSLRVRVRIGATGVASEAVQDLVRWAETHSPVGDALRRGVAPQMEIELV